MERQEQDLNQEPFDQEREDVEPAPEPAQEPHEHLPPLEDPEDARFLDPVDPRRREVEQELGHSFEDED